MIIFIYRDPPQAFGRTGPDGKEAVEGRLRRIMLGIMLLPS